MKTIIIIALMLFIIMGCGTSSTIEIQKTKPIQPITIKIDSKQIINLIKKENNQKKDLEIQKKLKQLQELEQKRKLIIQNRVNNHFKTKIEKLGSLTKEMVYYPAKNLVWQDNKKVKTIALKWKDAHQYCKNLKFQKYRNWRLPTKDELISIVDKSRKPSIKKEFHNINTNGYWSASSGKGYKSSAWSIYFANGRIYASSKKSKRYVRCVRDGELTHYIFYNPKKFKIYKILKGQRKSIGRYSYSKKPFQEIEDITQFIVNLYLKPRNIEQKRIPSKIIKPKLPPRLPDFVKGEYETKKLFEDKIAKVVAKREKTIQKLQEIYRKDVEKRNKTITLLKKEIEEEQNYKREVIQEKIIEWQKDSFNIVMGGFKLQKRGYDVETSTMYLTMRAKRANYRKKISIKITPQNAKNFSQNIENVKLNPIFDFSNNQIVLKSIDTNYSQKKYIATLNNDDFKPEEIRVSIKDKKINFNSSKQMKLSLQNPNLKDRYQIEALAYKDSKEIKGVTFDDDIPTLLSKMKQTKIDNKKWLFIIGIEHYNETDNILYAKRSAETFKKVVQKSLGISERHSYTLIDNKATGTAIKNRIKLLLSEVKRGDTIYFYYNGHGIPDPKKGGEPYMLPSDGIPDFIVEENVFALKNIYKELSDSRASKIVAFIDSCFSGATDGVSVIKGVAGSRLAPKKIQFNRRKMVVLTAGQKKQYSNMYKEKGHRLFSYFVMKSLLDGKKDINILFKEVSYKVTNTSNMFGILKKQEPTIMGNINIEL